ncbi:tetratricopeptide repeat protein [Nostoc sp.]|uniref:tetratricopeptide repeat protein n=1 Tax=Nostoc sp. TaxID=1180 RepID=UPI002FF66C4A
MDWTTTLRVQQSDFIQRLKSGYLLRCEIQGLYSELTIICGNRLKQLRNFCWEMAEKYKRNAPVRKVFINNMQGKLAEEVVKARLADIVSEVDYEIKHGGDGQVDFRLNFDTNIGIQVKSCQCWNNNFLDKVCWSISEEEINKNTVLICILIQGRLEDDQAKDFNLVFAGFLPTNTMNITDGKASVAINELLYGGGLRGYLENLVPPSNQKSLKYQKPPILKPKQKTEIEQNIVSDKPDPKEFIAELPDYINLGNLYYHKGEYLKAIANYDEAIKMNFHLLKAYYCRGLAYLGLQEKQQAIKDFTDVIKMNSKFAPAYYNRGLAHYYIGEAEAAIADFTDAIKINPNYVVAYIHRGQTLSYIGEKQSAIADFQKAADFYSQQNRQTDYQNILCKITKLLDS